MLMFMNTAIFMETCVVFLTYFYFWNPLEKLRIRRDIEVKNVFIFWFLKNRWKKSRMWCRCDTETGVQKVHASGTRSVIFSSFSVMIQVITFFSYFILLLTFISLRGCNSSRFMRSIDVFPPSVKFFPWNEEIFFQRTQSEKPKRSVCRRNIAGALVFAPFFVLTRISSLSKKLLIPTTFF